jgi:hypothetical protein
MWANFRHLHFNSFSMIWRTPQGEEFWPLQSCSENSGIFSGLQLPHGSSLGSVRVHFLTLFALPGTCEVTPGSPSWPATLPHLALVMSPRLGLRQLWWAITFSYFIHFYRIFSTIHAQRGGLHLLFEHHKQWALLQKWWETLSLVYYDRPLHPTSNRWLLQGRDFDI